MDRAIELMNDACGGRGLSRLERRQVVKSLMGLPSKVTIDGIEHDTRVMASALWQGKATLREKQEIRSFLEDVARATSEVDARIRAAQADYNEHKAKDDGWRCPAFYVKLGKLAQHLANVKAEREYTLMGLEEV